ncbi:MAG: hypothetical protein J6K98_02865, partial [Clostridia bacterium]|nr:hypothetical protein [Clostridia bacterium]
ITLFNFQGPAVFSGTALLFYHTVPGLSIAFCHLFLSFFATAFPAGKTRPFFGQPAYYTPSSPTLSIPFFTFFRNKTRTPPKCEARVFD